MSVIRSCTLALAVALITPAAFAADAANGKTLFEQRCGICHATTKDPGGPALGPNLAGIVGRKAADDKSFAIYTEALKTYGAKQKWTVKNLDEFLKSPFTVVVGTSMPMPVPDDKERADVIAYLGTLK